MKDDNKLAKWLAGEMDEKELREFESLPEFETYKKIADYSAQLEAPETDTDAIYNNITANRNNKAKAAEPKVIRLHRPWLVRIAAVLIIALCFTFFYNTNHTTTEIAAAGEKTEFLLPDNSKVVLNSDSEAEYKSWNWNKKRSVELKGEAFFKVAKGKTFDVNTPLGTVTVVGTQFNVKARDNRFDVTCFEGKVKVTYKTEEVFLTPGESVTFEEGEEIEIPETKAAQPGWINNEITFTAEKPENVIKEIERHFAVSIQLDKNVSFSAKSKFEGTLPMNDLETTLSFFTEKYHLKAEKTGKGTVILSAE
ncbi:DUF4974 domain-containing protein [Flavobacterium alkalisoli]|uniref:DUF4974 domain-containing protein n=1 Tax=Flavobacterium alkalisoli TaxID=2602769 RepID=A0A5B9FRJ3_9FLAO|nr:FecR family protein [Flavobacterium alkalisoli]QEE49515.1 DUF4974 domain-containing protein [Flavobacterium alkalisoli]